MTEQRSPRIVIIGAGPGGICAAIELGRAGFDDIVILDKADGVGGVWWHNTYPGAACDVRFHAYSFSFAPDPTFGRPFADQPEIQAYFERCVDEFGLRPLLRLGHEVTAMRWDDESAEWHLTARSEHGSVRFDADVVIGATGMFNELSWPDIDGLDDYSGAMFHSARWDHSVDLDGATVGVIGSAASATQFVPQIAPKVGQLYVFQRTANWVMPKPNDPYDAETLDRLANVPGALDEFRAGLRRDIENQVRFPEGQARRAEELGLRQLEVVEDPVVRAKLTPTHPFGCKRPLIADDYYPTFNRRNVELVTEDIEAITVDGVRTADGVERRCDVLVVATGFQTTRYLTTLDAVGRDGTRLRDEWAAGPSAYLGITTPGFPNLFMIYGPNTNPSAGSIIYVIEAQVAYIRRWIERMRDDAIATVEVRPEATEAYNAQLQRDLDTIGVWQGGCGNYYRPPGGGPIATQSPYSQAEYDAMTTGDDLTAYLL